VITLTTGQLEAWPAGIRAKVAVLIRPGGKRALKGELGNTPRRVTARFQSG
jgi:hypothetical protein